MIWRSWKAWKGSLKCILNKSACVVAIAYVEIYYRLILSTLLDYSYSHIASNIRNCIRLWVLACKSHHVKFPTITIDGEHSFVKLCQVDTLNVFAVFEIRIALFALPLHLLIKWAILWEKPVCSIFESVWFVRFESRLSVVVMRCIMVDLWKIRL